MVVKSHPYPKRKALVIGNRCNVLNKQRPFCFSIYGNVTTAATQNKTKQEQKKALNTTPNQWSGTFQAGGITC